MGTNFSKSMAIGIIAILISSCNPSIFGSDGCQGIADMAREDGLIQISPLKAIYQQGDEVVYSVIIPSENDFFDFPMNIYERTGATQGWYMAGSLSLFDENDITFVKGSKRNGAANWFNAAYNPESQNYELEMIVKLNRLGNYEIFNEDDTDFIGSSYCKSCRVRTNIQGTNGYYINFTVE